MPNYFAMSAPTAKCRGEKGVRVEGKVRYRLDAKPDVDGSHEAYRGLKRERTERAEVKLKSTQLLDERSRALAARHLAAKTTRTDVEAKLDRQFQRKTVGAGAGERADARDTLYDTIYKCFERRERWSMRELTDMSSVPQERLREVLNEIAVKITKGPSANMYMLKPEHRQRTRET